MEIRQIWTSAELNGYLLFPHAQQVLCIHRDSTEIKNGKQRHETVYAITSLPEEKAGPATLLELNRGHWGIENGLHYVRDVTFHEDGSQIRTKNAPRVMATLRNLTIGLLRLCQVTNIAKALRKMSFQPFLALQLLRL